MVMPRLWARASSTRNGKVGSARHPSACCSPPPTCRCEPSIDGALLVQHLSRWTRGYGQGGEETQPSSPNPTNSAGDSPRASWTSIRARNKAGWGGGTYGGSKPPTFPPPPPALPRSEAELEPSWEICPSLHPKPPFRIPLYGHPTVIYAFLDIPPDPDPDPTRPFLPPS